MSSNPHHNHLSSSSSSELPYYQSSPQLHERSPLLSQRYLPAPSFWSDVQRWKGALSLLFVACFALICFVIVAINGVEIGVPMVAPGEEYMGGRRGTSEGPHIPPRGSDDGGAMAEDNEQAAGEMDEETSRQLASLQPITRQSTIPLSISIPAAATPDGHHSGANTQVGTFSGQSMVTVQNTPMIILVNGTIVTGAANPNSNQQYLLDVQFYGVHLVESDSTAGCSLTSAFHCSRTGAMVFDVIKSSPPSTTASSSPAAATAIPSLSNGHEAMGTHHQQPATQQVSSSSSTPRNNLRPRHLFSPAHERAQAAATAAGSTTSTSTPSLTASLAAMTRYEIVLTPMDAYGNALSCVDTCATNGNGNGNGNGGGNGNGSGSSSSRTSKPFVRPHVPINAAMTQTTTTPTP